MMNVVMMSVVALSPIVWINKLKGLYLQTFFSKVQCFQGRRQGILKGKCHCTIDLLFDWFELVCFAKKNVNSQTADSKPVKQEVNSTVILPPLVFPEVEHTNEAPRCATLHL